MPFHLAEFNVARLSHPLDSTESAEFVAVLDAVNMIAEASPGFVWRLQADGGLPSSYVTAYDDPRLIINLTVWEGVESLRHFAYRSGHGAYFRRRREWFETLPAEAVVCWWIVAGHVPSVIDATARLERLRHDGPGPDGFLLSDPLLSPGMTACHGVDEVGPLV
ncbi:MAG: DUF3291 domain-containing protein [Ilumatobacteraceae bacterium]